MHYIGAAQGALMLAGPRSNNTLSHQFEKQAARRPKETFLFCGDRRFTFREGNALVNRHVAAYRELGLKKGDVVALYMENRPEYLWHFLALGKLGLVGALINTNLTGPPLVHAIRVGKPSTLVVGSELWSRLLEVRGELGTERVFVDHDPQKEVDADAPGFGALVASASDRNPPETARQLLSDLCCYIYTSGTTGLPKAAVVKHIRPAGAALLGGPGLGLGPGRVLYNCLPLYHSNGLMIATGSAISTGGAMALARKFSASRFWDDCRKYDASSFIYIGELCRYLMNQPERPDDADNPVERIAGNGLRPDIWEAFQKRFDIPRVVEFYGATEGNVGAINLFNVPGSVGKLMPGAALVRWNDEAQDFVRNRRGFLVRCWPNEPGVLLGRIRAFTPFDGYSDREETSKKVLQHVFRTGDAWFNTGDLLRVDWRGNLYFVDRVGDTFRWKGENVSTLEVQEQLSSWPPVAEANVYGVRIEGTEGRAGMASLVLTEGASFDPKGFQRHVDARLPAYARPLFVRLGREHETTGTLKLKKSDLVRDGFDPSAIPDPIFFRHPEREEYVPLTPKLHAELATGRLRL
jgi:fatty-acyl-CoA synthase